MRILVTGATGVVGRRAVPALIAAGHQVTASGRDPGRCAALARAGASVVRLDLFDPSAVRRAMAGHQAVINLATHMPKFGLRTMLPGAFRENDRVRAEGAANLGDAAIALGVERFVQESFAPVYEDGGSAWLDERAPLRPARYNRTVLDAERAAEQVRAAGRHAVTLRFAGFYGADSQALAAALDVVRRGWSPLPGAATAYWSSISHDDAATAVVAAITIPSGVYNVCDDEPLTRREHADAVADAFGLRRPRLMPSWMTPLMGSMGELMSRSQRMSNAELRAAGWAPRWRSARDGLPATAGAMRDGRGDRHGGRAAGTRSVA